MSLKALDLQQLAWPAERLGEAVEIASLRTGLIAQAPTSGELPGLPPAWNAASLTQWMDMATLRLGIEAEPIAANLAGIDNLVRKAAPAILRLPNPTTPVAAEVSAPGGPTEAEQRFLVLLSGGRYLSLLGLDLKEQQVSPEAVHDALYLPLIAPWANRVDQLLAGANIPEQRRPHARLVLLEEQFASVSTNLGWLLRVSPGADLLRQARMNHMDRPMLAFLGAYLLQTGLQILAWGLIGRGILSGQIEQVWLWAWALVLFTAIPFQLLVSWSQGYLAIMSGAVFKQRLLFGALKMQPDALRTQGTGQFLGRVMESDAIEALALDGGLVSLISIVQLGTAGWVLSQGVAAGLQLSALLLWVLAILLTSWLSYRKGRNWTETYRNMTNNLVERMVGHRTRLAQESPQHWHAGEDQELARYQNLSAQYDQNGIVLSSLPASWIIVGLACLIPALLAAPVDMTKLAVSLGGVMLAYQAFGAIQAGLQSLIRLNLAWGQVKPLFQAASQPNEADAPVVMLAIKGALASNPAAVPQENAPIQADESQSQENTAPQIPATENLQGNSPLLVAQHLNYRYRANGRLVLQDCSLQIFSGDRILLEGSSGGGKSTLAAVLAGLRHAESGALLLHGYDRPSLGADAWRKCVVIAPQFHENHVFSETFAFNLLMGRSWPPSYEDFEEAQTICNELGLADLLARMPSGWQQMVGENGWQLSHGERSRVFIARALLQNADLIIMDESFGALDPENLYLALECVRKRAATLLVIAHP